jgi:hypothetical protein
MELPPLYKRVLAGPEVAAIFDDVGACTDVADLRWRPVAGHERGEPDEGQLARLCDALLRGEVWSVQVCYRWSGSGWIDTFLKRPEGFEVVRTPVPDR